MPTQNYEKPEETEVWLNEVNIAQQLIKEIKNPLDLLRELISNSAAKEVKAKEIKITVQHLLEGTQFSVEDNGIGMDLTKNVSNIGRLDRFLSFGYSGGAGYASFEFSWKGIGSKLAFRSKRLDVETVTESGKRYNVRLIEPWDSIEKEKQLPKPTYDERSVKPERHGTKITVSGYPLYRLVDTQQEYYFNNIKNYLLHRTFIGFTKERDKVLRPSINLIAQDDNAEKREEYLDFGFPVLREIEKRIERKLLDVADEFLEYDDGKTIFINIRHKTNGQIPLNIYIKGLYTTKDMAEEYGLFDNELANGLILSVNGIPYCKLDLNNFCEGGIAKNPSEKNLCLICECDEISDDMNIARNGYTSSAKTELFEEELKKLLERINKHETYQKFRVLWQDIKDRAAAKTIEETIKELNENTCGYVYLKDDKEHPLHRIPQTEQDVLAILWKLEGAGKLKKIFKEFRSLAATTYRGTDLVVDFAETEKSPINRKSVEAKFDFSRKVGHAPEQTPIIICWEIGKKPITKLESTQLTFKYLAKIDDKPLEIFVISKLTDIIEIREGK